MIQVILGSGVAIEAKAGAIAGVAQEHNVETWNIFLLHHLFEMCQTHMKNEINKHKFNSDATSPQKQKLKLQDLSHLVLDLNQGMPLFSLVIFFVLLILTWDSIFLWWHEQVLFYHANTV